MFVSEMDNIIDASCYVAVYEERRIGNTNKHEFVLLGQTELIVNEPKYSVSMTCEVLVLSL